MIAAGLLLLAASPLWGAPAALPAYRTVAILPFIPTDDSSPREGWSISVKLTSKLDERVFVRSISWKALSQLMEERNLDKKRLSDPAVLREIGRLLEVQGVITGEFSTQGPTAVAHPKIVHVETGKTRRTPSMEFARDFPTPLPLPAFAVEPPVIDEDEALEMRDSPADNVCDGVHDRVDELEKGILDLKARYWALQLRRGVSMAGLKFNPGSTITDPELKKEFYGRMRAWMKEEIIPELTPIESKHFAEADEEAIHLARLCRIL